MWSRCVLEALELSLLSEPIWELTRLGFQVYDQHLDFLVLSPSLFSLSPSLATPTSSSSSVAAGITDFSAEKSTYEKLNDPRASESDIEEVTDRVARGLFSVLVTMGAWYWGAHVRRRRRKLIDVARQVNCL